MEHQPTALEQILRSWASLASHYIGDCFDVAKPHIEDGFAGYGPLVCFVAAQLYIDCHLSSESVLLLTSQGKEWDADLISRAIMEGSIKLVYMLGGARGEVEAKVDEFWNVLPEIARVKHHDRACRFLAEFPDGSPELIRPFRDLVLDESEVERIRLSYPKKRRHEIEQKWSFSEMCRALDTFGQEGMDRAHLLAHGYGMSSHLVHKDGDGVGMVWERYRRTPKDITTVKLAHSARLVSDVCEFSVLRTATVLRANGVALNALAEIREKYEDDLNSQLRQAATQFVECEFGKPI